MLELGKKINAFKFRFKDKNSMLTPNFVNGNEVLIILKQCSRCKNYSEKTGELLGSEFLNQSFCDYCLNSYNEWFSQLKEK